MFVNAFNLRFRRKMWSDSRLVNKQGIFCLCTKCIKENGACIIHENFMGMTKALVVGAPVIACVDFIEDITRVNILDKLYEPSQEKAESYPEIKRAVFADDWETQKKRWGIE